MTRPTLDELRDAADIWRRAAEHTLADSIKADAAPYVGFGTTASRAAGAAALKFRAADKAYRHMRKYIAISEARS